MKSPAIIIAATDAGDKLPDELAKVRIGVDWGSFAIDQVFARSFILSCSDCVVVRLNAQTLSAAAQRTMQIAHVSTDNSSSQ